MMVSGFDMVTGAGGYTGKYIAARLLERGRSVMNLTGHSERTSVFGARVPAFPLCFDRPRALADALAGADTLYNTYWVRFAHGRVDFDQAVAHTAVLIRAAEQAGVRRLVHISITSASTASPLPYFRGKGRVEELIAASRLSYAILRPTVVFGREDILINNVAWLLRRLPFFVIPGAGDYRLQPVFVGDLADMAVACSQRSDNLIMDAVGPEVFTFERLVRLIAATVRRRAAIVHAPPRLALGVARVIGWAVGDVMLTSDEVAGLMADLLISHQPPTGTTRLRTWLKEHAADIGQSYASELRRHFRDAR